MRVAVIAVGRLKQGPERDLADRYRTRFDDIARRLGLRGIDVQELPESRARDAASRIAEEGAALAAALSDGIAVALDERGEAWSSARFAERIGGWRDQGAPALTFLIGGADGLSPELRAKADARVSFGAATWPHQLVRVLLLEQLYRTATILAGHPYHRS